MTAHPHRVSLAGGIQPHEAGLSHDARCSCGWSSGPCATPVLAEAAAEQHLTLVSRPLRTLRRREPSAYEGGRSL